MMKRSLSAGILAGGKSIRMGEDKRLMIIGGETMLGRLVKELAPLSPVISAPAEGLPKEVL
jgi:molybdopterin-guanine dinucleotide biosynthesis protein A